jgi:hypothetical protein
METINDQLKELYISKFTEGTPCFLQYLREKRCLENKKEQPAYPLLLKINEEKYHNADLRIMIFGQETNSWEQQVSKEPIPLNNSIDFTEQTVDTFMNFYNHFLNEKLTKKGIKSPFWNAHCKIQKGLSKKKVEIVWNNVYKIGNRLKNRNRPHENIRKMENASFDVISKEIEILKPDVLIFFTGPHYDPRVDKKFHIKEVNKLSSKISSDELALLSLENEIPAYRTYHPRYLQSKKLRYINLIVDGINERLNV